MLSRAGERRGTASLEPYDTDRAERPLRKYLGDDPDEWPDRFVGLSPDDYRLLRFEPETVVARDQSYPALSAVRDADE